MSILVFPSRVSYQAIRRPVYMPRENLSEICRFHDLPYYKSGGFSPTSRLGSAGLFPGFSLGFGMDKTSLVKPTL